MDYWAMGRLQPNDLTVLYKSIIIIIIIIIIVVIIFILTTYFADHIWWSLVW